MEDNHEKILQRYLRRWNCKIRGMIAAKITSKRGHRDDCYSSVIQAVWKAIESYDRSRSNGKKLNNWILLHIDNAINDYLRTLYAHKNDMLEFGNGGLIENSEGDGWSFKDRTSDPDDPLYDNGNYEVSQTQAEMPEQDKALPIENPEVNEKEAIERVAREERLLEYEEKEIIKRNKKRRKQYDKKRRRAEHIVSDYHIPANLHSYTLYAPIIEDLKEHLDDLELHIVRGLLEGYTATDLAKVLGYKDHSYISKRLRGLKGKIAELAKEGKIDCPKLSPAEVPPSTSLGTRNLK